MRGVGGNNPAQGATSYDIANKMIVHRDKAHEHWNAENKGSDLYGSTMGYRNYPNRGESQDSASVARWKTADVIAALKRMETVCACADERWIIMGPSVRPIATANIPQGDAKIVSDD
jgi:hypothetical protein